MRTIILKTDSYKIPHWEQAQDGTTADFAYFESRVGAMFDATLFFGLQGMLLQKFAGSVVTRKGIEQAARLCKAHFGNEERLNRKMWEYILRNLDGKLPIRIKAVKEGTIVPVSNILMSVENTNPRCSPLTRGLESALTHVWFPSTVVTLSHYIKTLITEFFEKTSDNSIATVDFMLHDFGYRGVSSDESAEIGGAAHLVNFLGTDTLPALVFLAENYLPKVLPNPENEFEGLGYSVPATEHGTMTPLGRDGELAITRQLIQKYPEGILSVVGDSYNIYNFVENIMGKQLKSEILARKGIFVVRPDSITPQHPTPADEMVWILKSLADSFGYTINSKGFTVINPSVRALWGDGLDKTSIRAILEAVVAAGFGVENIACFGMGGGLLQKVNRDTQRFAFKSSWQERNGIGYDVSKEPLDTTKTSKKGRLKLIKVDGKFQTVPESHDAPDELETVFLNGKMMRHQSIFDIRALVKSQNV